MRMNLRSYLLGIIGLLFSVSASAQKIYNRIIIKSNNIESIINKANPFREAYTVSTLSNDLGLYCIEFDSEKSDAFLNQLRENRNVLIATFDQHLQSRAKPNDAFIDKQWYVNFLNLPRAWDVTTGGKTVSGKEIVIAILDSGIDISHKDLAGNIFINAAEIPNDGKDNDGNGYIDDVNGINTSTNNGAISTAFHGTWVSGIAGAKGNNGEGVTGMNWNVKILPITNTTNVSSLIKGYDYARLMRKMFDESGGTKGAFVVVANYSGGLENAFGSDPSYKPWCDMYDLLGQQGIISVGSTANNDVNVDNVGDLPSTCPSEFLISVTSCNATGDLASGSAFGKVNVDIAAPGENIFGLNTKDAYKDDTGTSASAPMVAGIAALLYSVPCADFDKLVSTNKVAAARVVRDAILNGNNKTSNLQLRTKTGGYLNAYKAMVNMQDACGGKLLLPSLKGALNITNISILADQAIIDFVSPDENEYLLTWYDEAGKTVKTSKVIPQVFGDKSTSVYVGDLIQGVYIISLYSKEGISAKKLFLAR